MAKGNLTIDDKISALRQEAKNKLLEGNLLESLEYYDKIIANLKDFPNN